MTDKDRDQKLQDSDKVSEGEVNEVETDDEEDIEEASEIEQLKKKADDNWNKFVRSQAELENIRKRARRDVEQAHKYAIEKFVAELVPVKESLDLGYAASLEEGADLEKIREGTDLTIKMMEKLFGKFNIKELNPVGEKFNPECHQAMSMLPSDDQPANTVLNVVQKGYVLNDRVIKPAMVVVSKGGAQPDKEEKESNAPGDESPSIDERA